MQRARDTKGYSLRNLEAFDYENMQDIRELAERLEEHAPGSVAAQRTRRVVALVDAAFAEADDHLRELWYALAYQEENGWGWAANVPARLAEPGFEKLAEVTPDGAYVESLQTLRMLREALLAFERVRDNLVLEKK